MNRNLYWYLALMAAGGAVYSGHLSYPFQFDSVLYLQENRDLADPEFIRNWKYFLQQYFYRGGLFWTFALNVRLGGMDPFGFHLFNLVVHLLNGLLVFHVVDYACRYFRMHWDDQRRRQVSGFTALLFLIHPLQTESVIYVISRSELLAGLFYLGGFHLLQRAWDRDHPRSLMFRRWLAPAGAAAALVIGYSMKPTLATMPFMAALYFFLGREPGSPALARLRRAAPWLLGLTVIGLSWLTYRLVTEPLFLAGSPAAALSIGRTTYFLSQPSVVVFYYMKLLLFPINLNVDPDIVPVHNLLSLRLWASLAVIGFWITLAARRTCKIHLFFACWFFVILSPSSSFVTLLDLAAEHRVYLASLGFLFALTSGVFLFQEFLSSTGRKMIASATLLLVVFSGVMAGLTWNRSLIWASEVTLWQDARIKSPGKTRPLVNLARANTLAGNSQTAIDYYLQSLKMNPFYFQTHYNLGVLYQESNQPDLALKHFRYAWVLKPQQPDIHFRLGDQYMNRKDFSRADHHLRRAVELNPRFASAFRSLGILYFYHLKKPKQAAAFFQRSLHLNPTQKDADKIRVIIDAANRGPHS